MATITGAEFREKLEKFHKLFKKEWPGMFRKYLMNDERHKSFIYSVDDLNEKRGEIVNNFAKDENYADLMRKVLDENFNKMVTDKIINNWKIDSCRVAEDEMEESVNNIMKLVPNGFTRRNNDVKGFNNMLDNLGREKFKYASNELKECAKYLRRVTKIENWNFS